MGDAPKRGDRTDPSGADYAGLLDRLKETERTARAQRETVKGMTPLERAPAPASADPPDE